MRPVLVLLAAFTWAGCASVSTVRRAPTPEGVRRVAGLARFEPDDPALRIQPGDTLAGGGCLNPMWTADGSTRMTLETSDAGWGDYRVPEGWLGMGPAELLRLDCNTGQPLGVVLR